MEFLNLGWLRYFLMKIFHTMAIIKKYKLLYSARNLYFISHLCKSIVEEPKNNMETTDIVLTK